MRSGPFFRDDQPESDTFFETSPHLTFGRSHLADRMGSSVFEDFPSRRTMRSFPSHSESPTSFGSRTRRAGPWDEEWSSATDHGSPSSPKAEGRAAFGSRHRQHTGDWSAPADEDGGGDAAQASPKAERWTTTLRRPFFQRSESIPVRVSHESRSSTPESTGSGHSHGSAHSKSHSDDREPDGVPEGVEEHPGVSARRGRPSFTARRQPKVHHIPIHVEPRDGSQPVVLTPPTDAGPATASDATESPNAALRNRTVFAMPAPGDVPRSPPDAPPAAEEPPARRIPFRTEETPPPPLSGEKRKPTPEQAVERVRKDVEELSEEVAEFDGDRSDKRYVYLDEMLTRNLIKLDDISTEGNEELRRARRAVVAAINQCIQLLEQKASLGEGASELPMEVVAADAATPTSDDRIPPNPSPKEEDDAATAETEREKMDASEVATPSGVEPSEEPSDPTRAHASDVAVESQTAEDGAAVGVELPTTSNPEPRPERRNADTPTEPTSAAETSTD